jgi:hypothetical protein
MTLPAAGGESSPKAGFFMRRINRLREKQYSTILHPVWEMKPGETKGIIMRKEFEVTEEA